MESHHRRARFWIERLSRCAESDKPILDARANYADGVRSPGGLVSDSMICFVLTHRCRRLNGRAWSHRLTSMTREIPTLTLCQSTWRRPAIRRHCSPHTSTASPLLWIMEHHSVCWFPLNLV